jgi:hypothetical protein
MISPSIAAPGAGGFAGVALSRGYIAAGFAGNDSQNDANAYVPLYPDFDFADLQAEFGKLLRRSDQLDNPQQVVIGELVVGQDNSDGRCRAAARRELRPFGGVQRRQPQAWGSYKRAPQADPDALDRSFARAPIIARQRKSLQ